MEPRSNPKRVSYISDSTLLATLDTHPLESLEGRASMVNALIESYGLHKLMKVTPSVIAGKEDLTVFHSSAYVDFMERADQAKDLEKFEDEGEEYGLAYDCHLFPGILFFCRAIAGGSLTAASQLVDDVADISINWCGGWHHAQRERAEGFCYVNDIVLAIHRLLERFQRVLYVDLDVHHGNGVEDAFGSTRRVLTLSLHKRAPGFYPGGGGLSGDDADGGVAKHAVNVPLQDGLTDDAFVRLFRRVSEGALRAFPAEAVVVQCGTDGLTGDPLGGFNLTSRGLVECVEVVLGWELPTLLLGGGGYNKTNAARCWTQITAAVLGQTLDMDIPDTCVDFVCYGPDFNLSITRSNRPDLNSAAAVGCLLAAVDDKLEQLALE